MVNFLTNTVQEENLDILINEVNTEYAPKFSTNRSGNNEIYELFEKASRSGSNDKVSENNNKVSGNNDKTSEAKITIKRAEAEVTTKRAETTRFMSFLKK